MDTKRISVIAMLLVFTTQACVHSEPTTLRGAAGDRFKIGGAMRPVWLAEPKLAELVNEQFSSITPSSPFIPTTIHPEKGKFSFKSADEMVDWAQKRNIEVIGHTLLWYVRTPKHLFEDEQGKPLPRDVALDNLKTHITTVMQHFKGRVKGWIVVNEAIEHGSSKLRESSAYRAIGEDYVLKAFEFAHAADPDAELYYNDYNIEGGPRLEGTLRLIEQIRDAGLRIDAVGIQGHYQLNSPPIERIEAGIKAYADAGFNVHITELDVDPLPRKGQVGADVEAAEKDGRDPYKDGFPDEMQKKLADRYSQLFEVFVKYPQVKRVTFWGTTDAYTWLNNWPVGGRTNHPMLWDRQYQPKPAFHAVMRTLLKKPDGTSED